MTDIYHFWGGDLSLESGGDLMHADADLSAQLRILRRLMTNPLNGNMPADYAFQPAYGAGLPRKVGEVFNAGKIASLIRSQMLMENLVARNPEPAVSVTQLMDGLSCSLQYTDTQTNTPQLLSFNVKA
jgi:hypothetical protein